MHCLPVLTESFIIGTSQVLHCPLTHAQTFISLLLVAVGGLLLEKVSQTSIYDVCVCSRCHRCGFSNADMKNSCLMLPGDIQSPPQQDATGSSQTNQRALHALLVEAEARTASGPRLLVQSLSIASLHLLVDVHAAGGSQHIPITVDTHRWDASMPSAHTYTEQCAGESVLFFPGICQAFYALVLTLVRVRSKSTWVAHL